MDSTGCVHVYLSVCLSVYFKEKATLEMMEGRYGGKL